MIDHFFIIFCLLSINNLELKGVNDFHYDYMEIENTNSVKGIFVWLIIFCHKIGYGNFRNFWVFKVVINLGQKVVSMFLFYSGFGIYEAIKKNGPNYIKTLPIKAFISLEIQ